MAAKCHSSFGKVTAAVTRTITHGLKATPRLQRLAPATNMLLDRSISSSCTRFSITCLDSSTTYSGDSEPARHKSKISVPVTYIEAPSNSRPKATRAQPLDLREALHMIPFDIFMRTMAPETYDGPYPEAQDLDEVLAGATRWAEPRLADLLLRWPHEHRLTLKKYLRDRRIDVEVFLSCRNAMLSKSWPDARRHMIHIADGKWPAHVLQRAVHTVGTPSEISDSLALLASTIQEAAKLTSSSRCNVIFKSLRYCFTVLTSITLKEQGNAFHLIPRLTDVLLALLERFPTQTLSSESFIYDFTQRCAGRSDERARQAVLRVLDWLQSEPNVEKFADVRHKVLGHCIQSIESSMRSSRNKTASSEHFATVEMMQQLLPRDVPTTRSDLQERALRCAVYIAGRGRDYRRIWQWFYEYEQLKQKRGASITGSDYLLLAGALVRTEQGRKNSFRIFLRAERLLQISATKTDLDRRRKKTESMKELSRTSLELLKVMANSTDVHLGKVLSMLGIHVQDSPYAKGRTFVSDENFSEAMRWRRADLHAYTVLMQGCLLRRRPKVAVTVWQSMLSRGMMPNAACLSLLLQNLFQMRDVQTALQQLHKWCEEGVPRPSTCDRFKDIEVETLATSTKSNPEALSFHPLTSIDTEAELHKVTPDPIMASVVFNGLHSCGAEGIEALWNSYQQTIRLFPDAPVLALLLKASCRNERTSSIDARFARQIFRTLLFGKHPELASYHNPLREKLEAHGASGWIFTHDTMGARMESWLSSVFEAKEIESPVVPDDLDGLVFTSKIFEHYVRLLLHLQHSPGLLTDARASRHELLDVLGWMKELNLTPSPTHLALTVLEIEEHLVPAVATRQMDILDAWLADWLGKERLPEEGLMQRHWQWKMERNGQRGGWFDRVEARPDMSAAEDDQ
ncbi:uncharacterized protein UTRI_10650_B [Ustilago trichophora]|uniref:Uncharacterized protein n=1 Tax=Ustilago trichophora TaxID=86804 RepID=A0A5C3EC30_9BASI|nr:uncharacterized protein UTRI_10650_B [Ustilago trichophora]